MVKQLKNAIRKQILATRDALSKEEIVQLSNQIAERLFSQPEFQKAKVVALYLTKGSEVDTTEMIEQAIKEGKEVLVPIVNHELSFFKFLSFADLVKGKFSIMEPKSRTEPSKEPDLVIVPGIGFGLCMHRLGYGKGYYDSFLATSSAYRIGIAFDFQVVEKLPTHNSDQKMNCIITDKRTIR